MIKLKKTINILATILVKDEEDIIKKNIEHHINQGVSKFIVTNNRSKDKTLEIISKYKEVVEIINETDETHNQSKSVTKMARLACKFNPDWIIHLDADELWCGLNSLKMVNSDSFSSSKMYLHPPRLNKDLSYYLDFDNINNLPGECKIGHRPDQEITIEHGNHGIIGKNTSIFNGVWRHHYPIRSYEQLKTKSVDGHLSLIKRNAICQRWKNWYDLYIEGNLENFYNKICENWENMIKNPNKQDLILLLKSWSTQEVIDLINKSQILPSIGRFPRSLNA